MSATVCARWTWPAGLDAARIVGHRNPATTLRTYAHALPENLRRGITLADDLLAPIQVAEVEQLPIRGAICQRFK